MEYASEKPMNYKAIAEELLHHMAISMCVECDKPQKKEHVINIENPLLCECSCEDAERVVECAKDILSQTKS